MFGWFRASHWPSSIMRVNCCVLLMMAFIAYTLQEAQGADTPATYTWQLERMQEGTNGALIQVLRPNDIVAAFQDVPLYLFPMGVESIRVACQVPPGQFGEPLRVLPVIYNADGYVRYVGNTDVAIAPGGFADIPLTEMYDVDREINAPVVLDWTDAVSEDGTGFYVGFQIVGPLYGGTMTDSSPNLVSAMQDVFTGFNVWGRGQEWGDMSQLGLPGNMGIRPVMRPFCPAIIGDIDGDGDIDNDDLAELNAAIAAGGDIFLDNRRQMDLNNDWLLDQDDVDILIANYTGANNFVPYPWLEIVTPQMTRAFRAGEHPPTDVFPIRNAGGGNMDFQVVTDVPWLTITPNAGTLSGETQNLALTFATESLPPGDYDAKVRVLGTAANSPQFGNIHVTIRMPGDYDMDGDVDPDDLDLFTACATGPAIPYAVGTFPPGCEIGTDEQGFLLADFDHDGDIDMGDFGAFQLCYGATPSGAIASQQTSEVPATWKSFPDAYRTLPDLQSLLSRKTLALPVIVWVVIVISVFAGILAYLLRSLLSDARFMNAGKVPDNFEGAQIRMAIDRLALLSHLPGAHPDIGEAHYLLSQEAWYRADTCGCEHLFVNRKPVGDRDTDGDLIDETGEEGTVASVIAVGGIPLITLRRDFVIHDNWTIYDTDRLAFVLLGEWEHSKYGPDEKTCQQYLEATVLSVQSTTGLFPSTLHFGHGANEGVGR